MKKQIPDNKDDSFPLLATKLFVPQLRGNQVRRSHLIDRLNNGIGRKLTLISAPAGFGKTTLLCEWISQIEFPVAWISLDKGDSDLVQFIQYLVAALRKIKAGFGEGTLSLLKSRQRPSTETILTDLVKEITDLTTTLILVFDDYHSINSKIIHDFVGTLLDYLPTHINLVISTRVDPSLNLSRLRVSSQLSELRLADLCFSADETTIFCNEKMKLQLSKNDISILGSRTEGWIAGLQLAAVSMHGRDDRSSFINSFAGDDRHIVDYLVEEVLALQPEPIQKFLLQTSILNRLSEALCDYITGETNSQIILDSLERTNLFIVPLDHKRQWYRYHHLFAELLQLRLHQMERDHVNELHNRASKWCQKNGLKAEAVNHAVATQDFERVARLISVYVKSSNDYDARLFEWHKLLPLEFIYKDPDLSFFNAWMLYENGQYNDAEKFLKIVEDLINSPIDPSAKIPRKTKALPPREKSEIQGKVAIIRAIIALFKGNIPDVIRLSNSAIEHLDRSDSPWWIVTSYLLGEAYRSQGEMLKAEQNYHNASDKGKRSGNYYIALIASLGVGDVRRFQGDLSGAMNIFDELFKAAQEEGFSQSPMLSILHISTGEVLGDLNKMNEALQHLQQGIDYSIQVNDAAMIGRGHLCLARIRFIKGDRSGAETIIRRMEKLSQKSDFPRYVVVLLEVLKVRIWLEKGNIKQAVQWMQNRKENRSGLTILLRESIQILFSRILFSQGKSERSLELLRQLIINAEKDGRTIRVIEMWVIRAKILFSIDDTSEATASMQKAIALAEPGGYITIFTSEGSPIADLLQVLLDEKVNISRAYVKKLLSAFQLAKLVKTDDGLVERLSERELEVLRFIAAGLSNKTITEEIHISMNTVKTHIRNIYSKLNVNSRMQATAKARELDLL